MSMSFELKVGELVEIEEDWKNIKNSVKKGFVFYDPKVKAYMVAKSNKPTTVEEFKLRFPERKIVLNGMPKGEAVRAWADPENFLKEVS